MGEFISDIRYALNHHALLRVLIRMRENDLLGLAGQLAYLFLLSFFPFLIFLVSLAGLALNHPESAIGGLITRTAGFMPQNAVGLLSNYVNRTLRSTSSGTLFAGIAGTLWLGSGSAIAITKAANRAYDLTENRPFWKLRGTSILIALGFTLLIAALTLVVFKVQIYARQPGTPPDTFYSIWGTARWVLAFVVVAIALDVLYYLAPNGRLPFRWIVPGGFAATILMFVLSVGLNFYVSNIGNYGRIYGHLGAVVVFMVWLYVTGLTVLLGIEINAVLTRLTEERKGIKLIRSKHPADRHPVDKDF